MSDTVTLTLRREDAQALFDAAPPPEERILYFGTPQTALLDALEKALDEGSA